MAHAFEPPGARSELALAIRPEPRYVGVARLFAASVARHFGCDEEDVGDLKIAVSEACTNAITAHRSADVERPIQIVAVREEGVLRFEIIDSGPGFAADLSELTSQDGSGELVEGNLGLIIIRSLFPGMGITQNESGGMTVSLTLSLDAKLRQDS